MPKQWLLCAVGRLLEALLPHALATQGANRQELLPNNILISSTRQTLTSTRPQTLRFRHHGRVSIVWCDGLSSQAMPSIPGKTSSKEERARDVWEAHRHS